MSWEVGKGLRGAYRQARFWGRCLGSKKGENPAPASGDPSDGGFLISCVWRRVRGDRKEALFLSRAPTPRGAFWEAGWDPRGVAEAGGQQVISGSPEASCLGEAEATHRRTSTHISHASWGVVLVPTSPCTLCVCEGVEWGVGHRSARRDTSVPGTP